MTSMALETGPEQLSQFSGKAKVSRSSERAFDQSYATLDENRRLLSWDDGFAREFERASLRIGLGLEEAARQAELPPEAATPTTAEHHYLAARRERVQIQERRMNNGSTLRIAANSGVHHEEIQAAALATLASIKNVRRRIDAELRESKRASEEANRLKSEFLANMSHEIRTPLNAIIGFTDIIRNELFGPIASVRYRDYLEHIFTSSAHLLRLVDDILDLAKLEAGVGDLAPTQIEIVEELSHAVSVLLGKAMSKSVDIEWLIEDATPSSILADRLRFRQVLINLIGNAVKFSEQGTIKVIAMPRLEGEAGVRFEVRDKGIGISPQGQRRLFQKFSQADETIAARFGGTGLGLAISKKLIDLMEGGIGVTSEIGSGSTFWIELPLAPQTKGPVGDV